MAQTAVVTGYNKFMKSILHMHPNQGEEAFELGRKTRIEIEHNEGGAVSNKLVSKETLSDEKAGYLGRQILEVRKLGKTHWEMYALNLILRFFATPFMTAFTYANVKGSEWGEGLSYRVSKAGYLWTSNALAVVGIVFGFFMGVVQGAFRSLTTDFLKATLNNTALFLEKLMPAEMRKEVDEDEHPFGRAFFFPIAEGRYGVFQRVLGLVHNFTVLPAHTVINTMAGSITLVDQKILEPKEGLVNTWVLVDFIARPLLYAAAFVGGGLVGLAGAAAILLVDVVVLFAMTIGQLCILPLHKGARETVSDAFKWLWQGIKAPFTKNLFGLNWRFQKERGDKSTLLDEWNNDIIEKGLFVRWRKAFIKTPKERAERLTTNNLYELNLDAKKYLKNSTVTAVFNKNYKMLQVTPQEMDYGWFGDILLIHNLGADNSWFMTLTDFFIAKPAFWVVMPLVSYIAKGAQIGATATGFFGRLIDFFLIKLPLSFFMKNDPKVEFFTNLAALPGIAIGAVVGVAVAPAYLVLEMGRGVKGVWNKAGAASGDEEVAPEDRPGFTRSLLSEAFTFNHPWRAPEAKVEHGAAAGDVDSMTVDFSDM